jgi:large subunit ribosomal protein LP0
MPAKARTTRTKEEVLSKKVEYIEKFIALLEQYPRILLCTCDNMGSKHMQQIRLSLRGEGGALLMGKNTLMRKAIRSKLSANPDWEPLLSAIKGNVGLVFTNGKLPDLAEKLLESTVPAVAKAGIIAPTDVVLPKQVTTLEPTKTSFFAALDIATKITKGCVEILNDVKLCESGKKVGNSEAALLQMLEIRPFTYGLKIVNCYEDGSVYDPKLLKFSETDLFASLSVGISRVAALSLATSYPTLPAFPHIVVNAFKNLVAICLETGYSFPQAEALKKRVENPDAYAPSVTITTTAPAVTTPVPVVQAVQEKSSSEAGDDGLMDFF